MSAIQGPSLGQCLIKGPEQPEIIMKICKLISYSHNTKMVCTPCIGATKKIIDLSFWFMYRMKGGIIVTNKSERIIKVKMNILF